MERLRAGLNGSQWVGWSYVFYPVTPGTSGRCRGGKERPARPPPASSHESHVLDNALVAVREPPPPVPAPRCLRLRPPFPERGGGSAARVRPSWVGGAEAGGNRGAGEGGELVTWANLPQGNEVSSRLLGGNGGGRIRPRLTQAGRGISPRSLQPNPLPPPPPGPLGGTSAQPRESLAPLPSPEAGVSFRPCFPAPTAQPRIQELPALGRDRGAGRMSPHGKRACGQALGQPRPPPSTLRAPDRGECEPRGPWLPRRSSPGRSPRAGGHPLALSPGCPSASTHPG